MGSESNPITHSEAFARTRHVHSCSTGHQQRGGDRGFYTQARAVGLAEAARQNGGQAMTYWDVRTKNVEDAAKTKVRLPPLNPALAAPVTVLTPARKRTSSVGY